MRKDNKHLKKYYYVRFRPKANIDYIYLLAFYDLAEYNKLKKSYNIIHYTSLNVLAENLNISNSTINRILSNTQYKEFLSIDKKTKTIVLHNTFIKGQSEQLIKLTADEVKLIREVNTNLFAKYLIYIKYYCGYTKDNKTDFTAQQFLSTFGYSVKSNATLDTISRYNGILVDRGIIKIEKFRDKLGHTRNRYTYN